MHKKDALPKKEHLKNKKDALPNMAVANPFNVKLKIARNTNKKAKVHERIIDKDKVNPFEMVFARLEKRRLEKRRMSLQKNTISSPNKMNKMQLQNHVDDSNDKVNYNDGDYEDEVEDDEVKDDEVKDDEVEDDEVDDEVKDDEVKDVVQDEVEDVVEDEVDEVGGHDEFVDEPYDKEDIVDSSKMIVHKGDTKLPMNDALLQYNNCKLMLKEKYLLITWHESLMTRGVTGMMVNSLEMIIKFSNEIVKVHGMEIPPRMTWMDGLEKGDPCKPSHVMHYGLKILFV